MTGKKRYPVHYQSLGCARCGKGTRHKIEAVDEGDQKSVRMTCMACGHVSGSTARWGVQGSERLFSDMGKAGIGDLERLFG